MVNSKDSEKLILITGASGQYGRLAVEKLLAKGVEPSALLLVTRNPAKLDTFAAKGAAVRKGSFDDAVEGLAKAFAGADVMLFIATSRTGARLPQHKNAVDAAVLAGVSHIVYTSIVGAHKEQPTALVAQEHRATEMMLQSSGLAWTALRDSQYAEAVSDVAIGPALQSGSLRINAGYGRIALISRDDCVAAAVAILADPAHHRNRFYDITGPELLSWQDMANQVSAITGIEIAYKAISDEDQFALFDQMGIPRHAVDDLVVKGFPWNSSDMVSFGKATRLGEMSTISNDVERLTGVKPRTFIEIASQSLAAGMKQPSAVP
ncbi:putative oxidoreductase [Xylariales sp. AK1849]|nr:putative oxidoreductase [Xylariales sp. AK1849]